MSGVFQPARLTLARRRRGIGKGALASLVGLSARIITDYEVGKHTPAPDNLSRLAAALTFPVTFFSLPEPDRIEADSASFRSMARMTARLRESALATGELAFELDKYIDARFDRPLPSVPDLRGVSPESAAEIVRAEWGIGARPITNLVHLVEAFGIRVFSLVHEQREVDAFSLWKGDVPYIFLNTTKSAERSRFDAAHELGHLVLHRHAPNKGKEPEQEADRFAAAFLMPAVQFQATAPRSPTVADIIKAKRTWGVSALAYTVSMHRQGMIRDWHYQQLCIKLRTRFQSEEPNGMPRETSQALAKVFLALQRENIGRADVARELGLRVDDLNDLVFGLVLTASSAPNRSISSLVPNNRPALKLT